MTRNLFLAFALAILSGGLATACGGDDAGPSGPESPGAQPPMTDNDVRECLASGDCAVASNEAECPSGFRFKSRDGDSNPPAICQRFEETVPPDAGTPPDEDAGTEQPTPDAGTPPVEDPCENLRVIEGEWVRLKLQWSEAVQDNVWVDDPEWPLSVRCEPVLDEDTCAVYFSGRGNHMGEDPFFGTELPLVDIFEGFTYEVWIEDELLFQEVTNPSDQQASFSRHRRR